ncbi:MULTISPECIES: hypothetical protein [unclassified Rhizobium]|uniref:hypothetical protein n=1 Tax=unclassified Rhizobium TaxID=2613769 RepID=UPI000713C722|nr:MULTISPECIES: hypothetical protein [unclassified Rhizobium]KQT03200.1 hypothetical protein ASG42_24635 [Rhizobium sp. Leaf391]KQU08405.1 hypothetical protein ASG68_22725 [Rhizobium sp. Leaf453]
MSEHQIRYLGDMQRLDLKQGDRFVLTLPAPASSDMVARLQEAWAAFADGAKLFVLEPGMKIGVISQSSEDESTPLMSRGVTSTADLVPSFP